MSRNELSHGKMASWPWHVGHIELTTLNWLWWVLPFYIQIKKKCTFNILLTWHIATMDHPSLCHLPLTPRPLQIHSAFMFCSFTTKLTWANTSPSERMVPSTSFQSSGRPSSDWLQSGIPLHFQNWLTALFSHFVLGCWASMFTVFFKNNPAFDPVIK